MPELANLEQLLKIGREKKRRYKDVTLPCSGLTVRLQSLTEWELSNYQTEMLSKKGPAGSFSKSKLLDANRRLFLLCIVDESGARMLNESHLPVLAEWDSADTSYLYEECSKHCGINRDDIEDLVKNSDSVHVEG